MNRIVVRCLWKKLRNFLASHNLELLLLFVLVQTPINLNDFGGVLSRISKFFALNVGFILKPKAIRKVVFLWLSTQKRTHSSVPYLSLQCKILKVLRVSILFAFFKVLAVPQFCYVNLAPYLTNSRAGAILFGVQHSADCRCLADFHHRI